MARAVLDPGVLVSALITPGGSPSRLLAGVRDGRFELVVSPLLLDELEGVLRRKKFRRYVEPAEVAVYLDSVRRDALVAPDPVKPPPLRCNDPDDDYLIALAREQNAILISGDGALLDLADRAPICSPGDFVAAGRV